MTDRELLARIGRSAGQKAGYKQLVLELSLGGGRERRLLLEHLARLTARGALVKLNREQWAIPRTVTGVGGTRENLAAGRLDLHRDGYGFVRPNARQATGQEDIFIPPNEINGAMQGDQVLVEVGPPKPDGRRMGRIARVIERRNATVVGVFHYARSDRQQRHSVVPFDERMTQAILIPYGMEVPRANEGAAAHRVLGNEAARSSKGKGRGYASGAKARHEDEAVAARLKSSPDTEQEHIEEDVPQGLKPIGVDGAGGTTEVVPFQSDGRILGTHKKVLFQSDDFPAAPESAALVSDDLEGLVVDVEITSWPTLTRPAMGRVIEVLGDMDDFGVDVEMMIRKHQLPRVFPDNVLAEARDVAHLDLEEVARRRDFRGLPIVTIDGETARDFDDAVMVTETATGYELQVHIADVAEYVQPGTDLDLEARLRGTSVYFPDRAIPMLPMELSTDICSLRPKEDRLVLSCIMQLDRDARIESYEVVEGVISSAARMTYTEVHAILVGDAPRHAETRAKYAELVPKFELMRKLAGLMNKRRSERGSIDFDLPEPVIEFDENGQMRGVTKSERTWANRLIEEFMLAANESVATWLEDLGVPSLYRIHEKPEARRVVQFEELAAAFGYSLGLGALPVKKVQTRGDRRDMQRGGRNSRNARSYEVPEDIPVTPRMYQKLAARIEGKPEERILSYLMLRSLRQARYSEINEGHFALAAPSYSHFTSPIRRYPDLIVHRITKELLREGVSGEGEVGRGRHDSPWVHVNEGLGSVAAHPSQSTRWMGHSPHKDLGSGGKTSAFEPPIPEEELAQIAEETSLTERRAAEAERELIEWKKVRFMQDRVGEEFAALVLNPAKYGLFVELTDMFVEGLVPIDSLRDDRYTWRENTHEIIGEHYGRVYRAGDRVQVILDRILIQERRLQFSIVEEGIQLTGKRPNATSSKSKKSKRKDVKSPAAKGKKRFGKKGKRR